MCRLFGEFVIEFLNSTHWPVPCREKLDISRIYCIGLLLPNILTSGWCSFDSKNSNPESNSEMKEDGFPHS